MKNSFKMVVSLFFVGLLSLTGACGKKDRLKPEEAKSVWEEQVAAMEKYIDNVEKIRTAAEMAKSNVDFAAAMEKHNPQINEILSRFDPKEPEFTDAESDTLSTLLAVLKLRGTLVDMGMKRFSDNDEISGSRERLYRVHNETNLTATGFPEDLVQKKYMDLLGGRITGGENLERLSRKLGKASLTSRVKITLNVLMVLSKAIQSFIKDYDYAPEVNSLEELSYYKNFVPLYMKSLITKDAWGKPLLYKADGKQFWLGSGGSDGRFDGFEQSGTYTELEGSDIIISGNKIVFGPALRETN